MRLPTIVIALALTWTPSGAEAATKIRTTIPANALFFVPQFLAQSRGFFADEGLDVETITTNGDGPDVDALISGSVEFTISTPNRLMTTYQQGKRLLAVMTVMDRMGIQCFMNKETAEAVHLSEARTPEAKFAKLKGLVIAGTRPGAFTYLLAIDYLKRAGLKPQDDAKVIGIGTGPAMIAAVENKQANVGCYGSPVIEAAVARGKSVWFINNTRGEDRHYNDFMFQVVYARPDFVAQKPEIVRAYVRALLRATDWLLTAPDTDLLTELKRQFSGLDDQTLLAAFHNVAASYSKTGRFSESSFGAAAQFLRDTDMLKGDIPWTAVTTNDYLPAR